MKQRLDTAQGGYTFVEIIVVVAIATTLMGSALLVMPGFVKNSRSDAASQVAVNALRVARERALGERRNFRIEFLGTKQIQVSRREVPGPATTIIGSTHLENNIQWHRFAGMPDTPDTFGGAGAIAFGATPELWFTSEGTLVDNVGDPINGTVFFANPADQSTARAITIFGTTGLMRVWKWNGRIWVE